jgi:surface protein
MSLCQSAKLTRTSPFTLTKDGLIKAISEVKNILRNNHFLCKSEYNLLLEMYIIIISFQDIEKKSSITKVFDFLSYENTGRYFFDFFINPIRTDNDILSAVKLWCSDRDSALAIYGHISFWDTSNVTDMNMLFFQCIEFNEDISEWNVSNVTNMQSMFLGARAFNQPIDSWDVSNVINMKCMFGKAKAFNQPIDNWNVSNVTNMECMFMDASKFNQPLAQWNVGNVTNMGYMFWQAYTFNYPLSKWNISKLKHTDLMFHHAAMTKTFRSDFIQRCKSLNIKVNNNIYE